MRRSLATRGRKRFAAAGALIVTATVLATVLSGVFSDDGDRSSRAATSATATTEIRRQDLVEVETEQGTQSYGDTREVINRLSGTITWLPPEGSVIRPDRVLFRVDGEPVILLDGRVPAYRDLSSATGDGSDVAQLERNLRAFRYDENGYIDLDDSWDSGTTAAVERWQDAHGLEQTGVIELGSVVFQPGKRRVASLESTLGGNGAGGGAPAGEGPRRGRFSPRHGRPDVVRVEPDPAEPAGDARRTGRRPRGGASGGGARREGAGGGRDGPDREEAPAQQRAPQERQAPAKPPSRDGGPPGGPRGGSGAADATGAAGAAKAPPARAWS